jgi:TetR/AcrR family transcriptional repressor of nem operon
MPYSKDHTRNARRRILDSAVQLFSQHGYDGVTLDEIMLGAKLTRGAFYAHFDSKRKIYVEAILHAAVHGPIAALNEKTDETALKAMVRGYLDMAHVKQLGPVCPLAFLVTDVANQESEIREVYTQVFRNMIGRVMALPMFENPDSALAVSALMIGGEVYTQVFRNMIGRVMALPMFENPDSALAVSALMIGGVAVARALNDDGLSRQVLEACYKISEQLI